MWVMPSIVERDTGLKASTLRGMIDRGVLRKGVEYAVIDRKRMYNLEAIEKWLDSKASEQAEQALRSDGKLTGSDTAGSSIKRRIPPTSRMQLV